MAPELQYDHFPGKRDYSHYQHDLHVNDVVRKYAFTVSAREQPKVTRRLSEHRLRGNSPCKRPGAGAEGACFDRFPLATKLQKATNTAKNRSDMHVSIERLYQFVMGLVNLTESEQAHVVRCGFCVTWLDACVEEKVSTLVKADRS